MATSYSDRVEAARKVLAEYGTQRPNTITASGTDSKTGEPVKPYSINDVAAKMAEALRAMIESEETTKTPSEIAQRVWSDGMKSENSIQDLLVKAVEAGIQAAWNSWENEDREPEPEEPIDLSQYSIPGFGNMQDALDSLTIRPVK